MILTNFSMALRIASVITMNVLFTQYVYVFVIEYWVRRNVYSYTMDSIVDLNKWGPNNSVKDINP